MQKGFVIQAGLFMKNSLKQLNDQISSLQARIAVQNVPNISDVEAKLNASNAQAALETVAQNLAAAQQILEAAVNAKAQYAGDDEAEIAALEAAIVAAQSEVNRLAGLNETASNHSREANRIVEAIETVKSLREQLEESQRSLDALNTARQTELKTEREKCRITGTGG